MDDFIHEIIAKREGTLFFNDYKSANKGYTAKVVMLNILLFAVFLVFLFILLIPNYDTFFVNLILCSAFYLVIAVAANIFFAYREKQKRSEYLNLLANFSENEYWDLCSQVADAEIMYGTLYMLDDYVYIPDATLLVPYSDIYRLFTVFRKRSVTILGPSFVESAQLRIMLENEKTIKVSVANMSDIMHLHQEYDSFIKLFEEKKELSKRRKK